MSFISIANTTNISTENNSYTVGFPQDTTHLMTTSWYLCSELCNKTKNNFRLNFVGKADRHETTSSQPLVALEHFKNKFKFTENSFACRVSCLPASP